MFWWWTNKKLQQTIRDLREDIEHEQRIQNAILRVIPLETLRNRAGAEATDPHNFMDMHAERERESLFFVERVRRGDATMQKVEADHG